MGRPVMMRTATGAILIAFILWGVKYAHLAWGSPHKAPTYGLLAALVAMVALGAQLRDWRGR